MTSFLPTSVQADENEFEQGIPFQGLLSSITRGIRNCKRKKKKLRSSRKDLPVKHETPYSSTYEHPHGLIFFI
jgi:hypothetical protein